MVATDLDELQAEGDRLAEHGVALFDLVDQVGEELMASLEDAADDFGGIRKADEVNLPRGPLESSTISLASFSIRS